MAILVDDCNWQWRGMMFCHMISDTSLDELHAFARWVGVPPRAFGGDHYDISAGVRAVAVEEGAIEVSSREVVRALYAAGLRKPRASGTRGSGSS